MNFIALLPRVTEERSAIATLELVSKKFYNKQKSVVKDSIFWVYTV
jgi:hypothetical protein